MKRVIALLLLTQVAWAQKVTVTDLETGDPIPHVYIFCEDHSATTNEEGVAVFASLESCKQLNFQHPGYAFTTFSIEYLGNNNYKVALEESFLNLQEVEVSYSKWEDHSREIPIDIARITRKEIKLQNPQTAADLLAVNGEVFVQKSQMGGGSPMLRGFSTSRVLLVVDGVRMNNAIFREGNVHNVISLDPNAISHTEVVFGPGSVIYGSDAIGGVMDFHTLDPQYSHNGSKKFSGEVMGRTASANFEKTGHAHFNIGGKNWASLTSFTFTDYDDLRMGSYGPNDYLRPKYQVRENGMDVVKDNPDPLVQRHTGYQQMNLMQKFRWRPAVRTELSYGFHYSTTSDLPRYDRLIQTASDGSLRSGRWDYGPQTWMMHNLQLTYTGSTALFDRMKTTLAYQQFEESRIDRKLYDDIERTRTENVGAYNAALDFEKSLSDNSQLYYGVEYVYNLVNSSGIATNLTSGAVESVPSRYPDNSSWQYGAAYTNLKQKLSDRLTLNLGARANMVMLRGQLNRYEQFPFDNIDNNFFAVNGSAGISWLPDESLQIRANISNGFRAPNVDDAAKIFDSGDGIVVVPNPDLQPEFLYTADLGFIKTVSREIQFELSGFYSILDNALVRRPFVMNGRDSLMYDGELSQVHALQNVASAQVWGGQAAVKIKLLEDLSFKSSVHYTNGKTDDGENLRHVAPLFGTAHLYFHEEKLLLDLYTIFNGEMDYEDLAPSERDKAYMYALDQKGNPYAPAWVTLNLKAEYQLTETFSLQGGVENIFDRRYQPYSSGITAAGRNFILAVRASF